MWDAAKDGIKHVPDDHSSWVSSVAFSHDGILIISGSADNLVKIWNTSIGQVELVLKGHSRSVLRCIFTGWDTGGVWFVGPLSPNLECTDGQHRTCAQGPFR